MTTQAQAGSHLGTGLQRTLVRPMLPLIMYRCLHRRSAGLYVSGCPLGRHVEAQGVANDNSDRVPAEPVPTIFVVAKPVVVASLVMFRHACCFTKDGLRRQTIQHTIMHARRYATSHHSMSAL